MALKGRPFWGTRMGGWCGRLSGTRCRKLDFTGSVRKSDCAVSRFGDWDFLTCEIFSWNQEQFARTNAITVTMKQAQL